MRSAILLSICLITGIAIASPGVLEEISTCGLDPAVPCVTIILGDIIIGPTDDGDYSNGSYAFQGSVTVVSGGTFQLFGSEVSFGDESPVHVQAGGAIVIQGTHLQGSATEGAHTPIIRIDAGATATIVGAEFTALTLSLATDDAELHHSEFQLGFPALRLDDFDGEISDTDFTNNIEGINATGGSPTFHDIDHTGDALGLRLDGVTNCVVSDGDMTNVHNGIYLTNGNCLVTNFALDDQSLPPDTGIRVIDGVGQTTISFNHIQQFGVGIYYCNADVLIHDNTFADNGEDIVACES